MLVVVVIIGILAGVLVPRLVGARERASDSGRIVKIWQISSAVELYAQENGSGTYPKAPLSDTPTSVATPSVSSLISPYLTTIPTDPGKGTVAIYNGGGNIMVTGDSFAYWTDTWWTVYAITALMESKKGNTTNAIWVIDKDKEGEYQVVGKGLITYILKIGITHEWNDLIVYDGTNKYVIADKNVWATVVGTDWTNPAIRGAFFQRGNNHPFSSTVNETITPNRTTPVYTIWLTTYTSGTWIYNPSFNLPRLDWSSNQNDNLRSDATQRKWPCEAWYHVPTQAERQWLYNTWLSLNPWQWANWNLFRDTLKLPMAGLRYYGSASSVDFQGSYSFYWSSTPDGQKARYLDFNASYVNPGYTTYRAYGFSVRCFKN